MTPPGRGTVLSVNVGGIREFQFRGRPAASGIWKTPVTGRVVARGVNLEGGLPGAPVHLDQRRFVGYCLIRQQGRGFARTRERTGQPSPVPGLCAGQIRWQAPGRDRDAAFGRERRVGTALGRRFLKETVASA